MKIAVYSPYLDTYGGGERYILTIAEILSAQNQVQILIDTNLRKNHLYTLKQNLSDRLNINLDKVEFTEAPLGQGTDFISRARFLHQFDVLFAVTDGSLFYSTAKKNILHIQSPLNVRPAASIPGKIKLKSWNKIIYNSEFTKQNSSKNWPVKSSVIYPPVDVEYFSSLSKRNLILSVGRFFGYLKEKKHRVMIETFADLSRNGKLKGWELHLAGSASEGDKPYLEELKSASENAPVFFHPNIKFPDLIKLYGESKIYWHAMGFKEDDPTKQEHFGITTVEAMASGCVPVVIKKGGQPEIVQEGVSGLFWESIEELREQTTGLAGDNTRMEKMAFEAVKRSKMFSKQEFRDKILKIIND